MYTLPETNSSHLKIGVLFSLEKEMKPNFETIILWATC